MLRKLIISLTFCSLGTSFASAQQLPSPDVARTIKQNLSAAVVPALVGTLESYWEIHKIDSFGNASIHKRLTSCEAIATENWVLANVRCVHPKKDYTSIVLEKTVFKTNDRKTFTVEKKYKQLDSFFIVFPRKKDISFDAVRLGELYTDWDVEGPQGIQHAFPTIPAVLADKMIYANTILLNDPQERKIQLKKASFAFEQESEKFPVKTVFTHLQDRWGAFTPDVY